MDQRLAYTLDEWCAACGISRATFYTLEHRSQAPRVHYIGARRYISVDADREWRAAREAEAAKPRDHKLSAIRSAAGKKGAEIRTRNRTRAQRAAAPTVTPAEAPASALNQPRPSRQRKSAR